MTTPQILRYARTWRATHELIHGPLSIPEVELANEVVEFLINCAQAEHMLEPTLHSLEAHGG